MPSAMPSNSSPKAVLQSNTLAASPSSLSSTPHTIAITPAHWYMPRSMKYRNGGSVRKRDAVSALAGLRLEATGRRSGRGGALDRLLAVDGGIAEAGVDAAVALPRERHPLQQRQVRHDRDRPGPGQHRARVVEQRGEQHAEAE